MYAVLNECGDEVMVAQRSTAKVLALKWGLGPDDYDDRGLPLPGSVGVCWEVLTSGQRRPVLVGFEPPLALLPEAIPVEPGPSPRERHGSVFVDRGLEILVSSDVWMGDWDFADPVHPDRAVSARDLDEVRARLMEWCQSHPEDHFELYRTPAGVRALLMNRLVPAGTPEQAQLHAQLGCDPMYAQLCSERGWYGIRVSPKPGRRRDYVARWADFVHLPSAWHMPQHQRCSELWMLHGHLCRRFWANDTPWHEVSHGEAPPAGFELALQDDPGDQVSWCAFADYLTEHDDPRATAALLLTGLVPAKTTLHAGELVTTLKGPDGVQTPQLGHTQFGRTTLVPGNRIGVVRGMKTQPDEGFEYVTRFYAEVEGPAVLRYLDDGSVEVLQPA